MEEDEKDGRSKPMIDGTKQVKEEDQKASPGPKRILEYQEGILQWQRSRGSSRRSISERSSRVLRLGSNIGGSSATPRDWITLRPSYPLGFRDGSIRCLSA